MRWDIGREPKAPKHCSPDDKRRLQRTCQRCDTRERTEQQSPWPARVWWGVMGSVSRRTQGDLHVTGRTKHIVFPETCTSSLNYKLPGYIIACTCASTVVRAKEKRTDLHLKLAMLAGLVRRAPSALGRGLGTFACLAHLHVA
jgi:hypothetical protein